MIFICLLEHQGTEGEDSGEGVIDLMSHTCCQFSKGSHFARTNELILNFPKLLRSFLNPMLKGLSPPFDGISRPLQFRYHVVEGIGKLSQLVMGLNAHHLVEISMSSLFGGGQELIDGTVDHPCQQ